MDTERVKDESLTFMEEFELLDREMTQSSNRKKKARNKRGTAKRKRKGSAGHFLSGTEKALIAAGCAVAVLAVTLSVILMEARRVGNAVRAFQQVGTGMEGIAMIGEEGVVAVAQAKYEAQRKAEKEKTKKEEVKVDEKDLIKVDMTAQTIKGDLKIKFLDSETGHIIEGVPFAAKVTDPDGAEERVIDEDKNGIIYMEDIAPGTYTVEEDEITGKKYSKYKVQKAKHTVAVSNVLAYEAVDVSDEVKDQSEVNTAAEDNMDQNDTPEEEAVPNTVELVESTKTLISGGESYREIPKSLISDPYKTASVKPFVRRTSARKNTGAQVVLLSSGQGSLDGSEAVSDTPAVAGVQKSEDASTETTEDAGAAATGDAGTEKTEDAAAENTAGADNTTTTGAEQTTPEPEQKQKTPLDVRITGALTPIDVGDVLQLGVEVYPMVSGSLTWTSSGEYAPVSVEGVVKAVKGGGSTVVTATVTPKDGYEEEYTAGTATVSIEVRAVAEEKVTIEFREGNRQVTLGYTGNLNLAVSEGSATFQAIPDDVLAIDAEGNFTALKAGETTVTATSTQDPDVKAICNITVVEPAAEVNDNAELKDTDGNQVYVKEGEDYRRAVNSDYNSNGPFYVMTHSTEVYRYTGFQTINGRTYYYDSMNNLVRGEQVIGGVSYQFDEDGALMTGNGARGIDVSEYNGAIDWAQVKASGVEFAIIRLGYRGWGSGVLVEDSRFRQNVQGAAANGIRVGVYFVTQAVNEVEAVEEASMVLGIIRNYSVSYPVFLDVETSGGRGEGRADKLSVGERTAVCNAFCRTMANSGYRTGVYANKTWLDNYIDTPQIAGYNIWVAQYYTEPTYNRTKFDMWQHTSSGSVPGIGGRVDLNICYTAY